MYIQTVTLQNYSRPPYTTPLFICIVVSFALELVNLTMKLKSLILILGLT